jgi:uncharacterized membrane protein YkoI
MKTCLTLALAAAAIAAETKVLMKDLPPAVQKAVQAQTAGAQIKGLSKETGKGKTVYEIETIVNGKSRDLTLDAAGTVVEIEEQVALDSIPAEAKAAIEKKAAGGRIKTVESVMIVGPAKGSTVVYEAAYAKGGKSHEVQVRADGSDVKD